MAPFSREHRSLAEILRRFAAGLVENAEPAWQQEQSGLTDEELVIAQDELQKIAAKIQATVTSTD
ncbi:MAG: hypothetical protein KGZ68_11845 [Dechloromonas sp.]|nr:hypothetical protein [Dechloromonas sp.]